MSMMLLGRLGSSWGVKGQIRAFSESGDLNHFASLSFVLIGEKEEDAKFYEIEDAHIYSSRQVLFKFRGIEMPEAVRKLSGFLIWGFREQATPLKEGEFYFSDLVGFSVFSEKGEALGIVKDILYGARQELLEVGFPSFPSLFLVPMIKPFVLELKEDDKRIIVNKDLVL